MAIKEALGVLVEGGALSEDDAAAAMKDIVEGQATPAQIGAFATALRMKGETVEEITGLARVMREYATRVTIEGDTVDLVGTGGDGSNIFNISTVSSMVVAAAGGKVAKHGNAGITNSCGSADILKAFGIAIDLNAANVAACVNQTGFGFMFAPAFHPATRHAGPARREIGIRTVFNILGPLTNPAYATHLLVGAAIGPLAPKLAMVLNRMGVKHALVVYGAGGLDELSITGPSQVYEVEDGDVHTYEVTPEKFGLPLSELSTIQGGTVEKNVALAEQALSGTDNPAQHAVLLNAGAGLYAAGLTDTISDGIGAARELIASRKPRQKLDEVREVSQQLRRSQPDAA
jgi:anthranilate phosphoribosyltransferase